MFECVFSIQFSVSKDWIRAQIRRNWMKWSEGDIIRAGSSSDRRDSRVKPLVFISSSLMSSGNYRDVRIVYYERENENGAVHLRLYHYRVEI